MGLVLIKVRHDSMARMGHNLRRYQLPSSVKPCLTYRTLAANNFRN
jgi:hypothetical protein